MQYLENQVEFCLKIRN